MESEKKMRIDAINMFCWKKVMGCVECACGKIPVVSIFFKKEEKVPVCQTTYVYFDAKDFNVENSFMS